MNILMRYGRANLVLMLTFLLAGCAASREETEKEQASCSFEVRTRGTTDTAPDDAVQYTQLYVVERLQEHAADHLHCAIDRRYKLTGGTYALTDLYGQWYKFAFVCVPQWTDGGGAGLLTEETPVDRTCDYNKLMIDFSPVLTYQKNLVNIARTADLNIYRQVIDRWIDPDATNVEDVELKRLTGEQFGGCQDIPTVYGLHIDRVTTVLYNGMQQNEFEVRYAGFAAGGDSQVDVDDDKWNGW